MTTQIRTTLMACTLGLTLAACDSALAGPDAGAEIHDAETGSRLSLLRSGGDDFLNPTSDQRIYFVSFTNSYPAGGFDLYAMNTNGSNIERLTSTLDHDVGLAVSPDGTRIAFARTPNLALGNVDIYTMNIDGSDVTQLTDVVGHDEDPTWSPDGSWIAFSSNRDGHYDLYMMASDGTGVERLTKNSGSFDGEPAWSPNGTQIAFTSFRDGNTEIYVLSTVGGGPTPKFKQLTRLTNHGAADRRPSWSPDGSKIAFESNRDGNFEIYTMNADGSGVVRLTNHPELDLHPVWSPGGSKIAFQSLRNGNYEIYTMNADGSNQVRITKNPMADSYPYWANVP